MGGRAAASVRGRVGRGVAGDGRRRLCPGPKAAELLAMVLVCGSCPGCACAVGETEPVDAGLSAAEGPGNGDAGGERRRGIMMCSRRGSEHV